MSPCHRGKARAEMDGQGVTYDESSEGLRIVCSYLLLLKHAGQQLLSTCQDALGWQVLG